MSAYKLKTPQVIEKTVVAAYEKIEHGVVGAYKKIEGSFVDAFLKNVEESAQNGANEENERETMKMSTKR